MKQIFREFQELFEQENKEEAVKYIINKLKSKDLNVIDLYTKILTPLLNNMTFHQEEKSVGIWKEHIRTAIARTIVECSYPYILEKRDLLNLPKKGYAAILCPPEEYHDLGARMVADFLTICGYEAIFVGSNTPYQDFYCAIPILKPSVIAISVSNYYHLVAAKRMLEEIKQKSDHPFKIVVGGFAFQDDPVNKSAAIGADLYADSFEDILQLSDGGVR